MVCIDTNIWIYLFTNQDIKKREVVRELIAPLSTKGIIISNQIYKEIANVLFNKQSIPLDDTLKILERIKKLATIYPETPKDIEVALKIKDKHKIQYFDSIISAFCLNNEIPVLITEDVFMQEIKFDNQVLKVINPF